ncbi:MAG: hypothetical protein AB1743_02645 [Actinomycetota bacterium]
MYYDDFILSQACVKCRKKTCVRCQDRICLNCKDSFSDRHNVDMITDFGVCVACGILLTEKYMSGAEPKREIA